MMEPYVAEIVRSFRGKKRLRESQAREILESYITMENLHCSLWYHWDLSEGSYREDAIEFLVQLMLEIEVIRPDKVDEFAHVDAYVAEHGDPFSSLAMKSL